MKRNSAFSTNVFSRLGELGLNQADLAELLEVHPSSVSSALKNGRKPRAKTVAKYAKALGVTIEYLISE